MPAGITIIGLGPGPSELWTRAAFQTLTTAALIYVPGPPPPALSDLPGQIQPLEADSPEQIAAELITLSQRDSDIIYAVPGHPALDAPGVPLLLTQSEVPVTLIPGLSLLDAARTHLGLTHTAALQTVPAAEVAPRHHPPFEPSRPALLTHFEQAAEVQRVLATAYPPDFHVTLLDPASGRQWNGPLSELSQQATTALTMLYIPADAPETGFTTFQETIAHLRAPEGCPWDRKQTHQTLRRYLLEEAYEVLDTLDRNDPEAMAEEFGDLLLQIVLHTQIAIDNGEFRMRDVLSHITRKMWRRHPHVFSTTAVDGVEQVLTNWDAIKKAEKAQKATADNGPGSVLDGVPPAMPALARAFEISKRVVRVGFEWPAMDRILDKIIEEAREIAEADTAPERESEIGDLLFMVVNLARWHGIDPETALRTTNDRFTRRFQHIEAGAAARGQEVAELSLPEMQTLWREAKSRETA